MRRQDRLPEGSGARQEDHRDQRRHLHRQNHAARMRWCTRSTLRERLIVIEDAPEIRLDHPNSVGPDRGAGRPGRGAGGCRRSVARVLAHAARPHPAGRIARARKPSPSCAPSTAAIPARITTVHADTPDGAIDQIALLAMTSGPRSGLGQDSDLCAPGDRRDRAAGPAERKRRVSDIHFLAGEHAMPPAAND